MKKMLTNPLFLMFMWLIFAGLCFMNGWNRGCLHTAKAKQTWVYIYLPMTASGDVQGSGTLWNCDSTLNVNDRMQLVCSFHPQLLPILRERGASQYAVAMLTISDPNCMTQVPELHARVEGATITRLNNTCTFEIRVPRH